MTQSIYHELWKFLSPYYASHQEYWALLNQDEWAHRYIPNVEYFEIVVRTKGTFIWSSGKLEIKNLNQVDSTVRAFLQRGDDFKVYLHLSTDGAQTPTSVLVRVHGIRTITPKKSGKSETRVRVQAQQYQSAVRKARTLTGRIRKSRLPRGSNRYPVVNVPRPSPEIHYIGVNRIYIYNGYPWNAEVISVSPGRRIYDYRVWSGTITPNFRKLKKRMLPDNPYSMHSYVVGTDTNLHLSFNYYDNYSQEFSLSPHSDDVYVPTAPGHLALAQNKAVRKLIGKADLGIDANLAQDAAQFSQLTSLISGTTKKIVSSVRDLRRGNIAGAINTLTAGRSRSKMPKGRPSRTKDLAENWLELQYGWKPLLMDIEGFLKSLSNYQVGEPTVRSVVVSSRAVSDERGSFNYAESYVGNDKGVWKTHVETSHRYCVRFRIDSPLKSFMAQLGFTNPINLVWEVLPFSFVVDWFLPIGPYLEALSAFDGATFLGGYQTRFTRYWMSSALDYTGPKVFDANAGIVDWHTNFQQVGVRLDRSVLSDFPGQTLPQLKNPFASVIHAANGIALLKSVFT